MKYRYIASCVFTSDYPELSLRIQDYLKERFGMEINYCTEGLRLAGQPHYHIAELLFPYSV
jgi:hypothetical protein